MNNFYILDNLQPKLDIKNILRAIDCHEDSPVYEEFVDEYLKIEEEVFSLLEPVGILGFGELTDAIVTEQYKSGTRVIYAVTSIGDKMKQCSNAAFQEGDYVKGMLYDAIGDEALFSLEGPMLKELKRICADHQVGILQRLEAPTDISMEAQKVAWEYLSLQERFGIKISSGYMYDPAKTSCLIFVLSADEDLFKAQHDCTACPNINCKRRNISMTEVKVQKENVINSIYLKEKESLMDGLLREGYYISAVCGGKGHCGKCKVRVLEGAASITASDEKVFSEQELKDGWRLSCKLYPDEAITISFEQNDESDFEVVSTYQTDAEALAAGQVTSVPTTDHFAVGQSTASDLITGTSEYKQLEYDIAVDIGTTTIVLELLEKNTGTVICTATTINSQRKYGADVISRIEASINGKGDILKECIRKDLQQGIRTLLEKSRVGAEQVRRIAIAGNTTMTHLLMGYDCSSLGVYPFKPVDIDFIKGSISDILRMPGDAEVVLLPGISTYVGGDIASGLYACGFDRSDKICLLVDLGTNGEMALGNREKILVTSTAAGPAFEGGNILWGMGSVLGAICSVQIEGANVHIQTIGGKAPIGICGTGVVETVAELVRTELVDETGRLDDDYFDDGFPLVQTSSGDAIVFTQKDIREIQLAKAAIRGGIETLLLRYGIQKSQVEKVYLAGGFGYRMDTKKAIAIGMLPSEFDGRIEAVGNSSLAGAEKYLKQEQGEHDLNHLIQNAKEVELSSDQDFNQFYVESMMFEE